MTEALDHTNVPFWQRPLPTREEVFNGELGQRGDWVVIYIRSGGIWSLTRQRVEWRGQVLWIIPLMKDFYPAIAIKVPPGSNRRDCQEFLMRFLSVLSWVHDCGYIVAGMGGGSSPFPMVGHPETGFTACEEFRLCYLPEPTDSRTQLALALMREGRALNHVAYAFLSFFRVLEVAIPKPAKRIKWVDASVATIKGPRVDSALAGLTARGIQNIGRHLYDSGRCAVAHATQPPIVDPDQPEDTRRLDAELPIMAALAQKAIEEELGIETGRTVFSKHLYELSGFKKILGVDLCELLRRGEHSAQELMIDIPDIHVRIRRKGPYAPMQNLTVKSIGQDGHKFYLLFESVEGDITFRFHLDFEAERLIFSIFDDVGVRDTGSVAAAARIRDMHQFFYDYFGNGELLIFNAETEELISRKDAYIPLNMILNPSGQASTLAYWTAIENWRHDLNNRFAVALARHNLSYNVQMSSSGARQ